MSLNIQGAKVSNYVGQANLEDKSKLDSYLVSLDKDIQNIWWALRKGFDYGELWVLDNATATTVVGTGTFAQFTEFSTNGESNNTTPDYTKNHIQIDRGGIYLVVCSFHIESIGGGAADTVSTEIRKNSGTTSFSNLHTHRKLAGGGGDIGSISVSGIAKFSIDDTVEVWITNDDNATDLLLADANLSVVRIGKG